MNAQPNRRSRKKSAASQALFNEANGANDPPFEPDTNSAAAALPAEAPPQSGDNPEPAAAEPSTALTVVGDVRVAMRSEQTRADIAKLLDTAKAITVITNADGRQQAHSLLMSLVKTRTAIDSRYEEVSANVRSFLDDTQTERDDLKKLSAEQEARIRKLRDDWDEDQKRIKREKVEAEQRRIDAIKARIDEIRAYRDRADGKPSVEITLLIQEVVALDINDTFMELRQAASNAKEITLEALRTKHANAVELERRVAELAEQERQLEQEREEQRKRNAQRLEDERQAQEAAAKREHAMKAIHTIQDRLADAAAGDTLEAYDLAISVTQGEPMTEERFGALLMTATKIRDNTYQTLRQRRIALAKRLLEEAEFAKRKAEQERQEQEAEAARKLREQRIGGINFIRAVVGMSESLTTVAEFDEIIADTTALATSTEAYGDLAHEATAARDFALDILRARRQILADRQAALSRETLAPPTDPVEAMDGEMASDAAEITRAATEELPAEADAPSVDEAILLALDTFAEHYGLDDVRGKELIVRMAARVQELAA